MVTDFRQDFMCGCTTMNEVSDYDCIREILKSIGDDPDREGLKDTPDRVVRSWRKLYGGYNEKADDVLKTVFTDGACDEMVLLRDIEFYSTCEHHMLPFFGKAHIGYIPAGRVVGISKLARLLEVYSRRLQIQEKLTTQIAEALVDNLRPKGVMVVLEAQHFCMTARGVEKQHSIMVTSAIRGSLSEPETRAEFLRLIGR
jgi:GTP cyclohydrolase I